MNHELLTMNKKETKNAEAVIKNIRRKTKHKFSSEEKLTINHLVLFNTCPNELDDVQKVKSF